MNPENPPPNQPQPMYQPQPTDDPTFQMLVPTKNKPALLSYYFGVFGLIPFLGVPLAIIAIVLGFNGLAQYKANPTPGAKAHAITGIVLGIFELVVLLIFIMLVVIGANTKD